jgi:hypothetical protein
MTTGLKNSTIELLRRFNQSFPQFYEQYASTEVQMHNLRLAYQIYQTQEAIIDLKTEGNKTIFNFAYRNQSFLLSDIFGVLAAYGLTIHEMELYGQIRAPMLIFLKLSLTRAKMPLTAKTAENVHKAVKETLMGRFEVEEMLSLEFNLNSGLKRVQISFHLDRVYNLPSLMIEADNQQGMFYKIMHAIWQEDLLVVSANLLIWKGRTRLIVYLLGPNENLIPEYLGEKIAESLQLRLAMES